MHQQRAHPEKI